MALPVEKPFCPYCGCEITPPPRANRKCPSCGERLYVRTRYTEDGNLRLLLTEAERDAFDDAWAPNPPHDEKEQEERYRHYYQLTEQEWDTARVMAEDLAAFRGEPVPLLRDIAWEIAGRKSQEAAKAGNWITLSSMYRGQSRQLRDEGRPFFDVQREAERWYLEGLLQSDSYSAVRVRVFSHACRFCRPLKDKIFDIKAALRTMPLPVKECTRGWRCCVYKTVPKEPTHIFPCQKCGEALIHGPVCPNCGERNKFRLNVKLIHEPLLDAPAMGDVQSR